MALKEWKDKRSFTSCEDCGSYKNGACQMELKPQRVGYDKMGDILDCKSFHYAPAPSEEKPSMDAAKEEESEKSVVEETIEAPTPSEEKPKKKAKSKKK